MFCWPTAQVLWIYFKMVVQDIVQQTHKKRSKWNMNLTIKHTVQCVACKYKTVKYVPMTCLGVNIHVNLLAARPTRT